MILALRLHPGNPENFLIDVAAVQRIELAIVGLELDRESEYLRVVGESIVFLLGVAALEDYNSSSFVPQGEMRTVMVKFQNRDDIFLVNFLVAALVPEHL